MRVSLINRLIATKVYIYITFLYDFLASKRSHYQNLYKYKYETSSVHAILVECFIISTL